MTKQGTSGSAVPMHCIALSILCRTVQPVEQRQYLESWTLMVCSLLPTLKEPIKALNLSEGQSKVHQYFWAQERYSKWKSSRQVMERSAKGSFSKAALRMLTWSDVVDLFLFYFAALLGFVVWSWSLITHIWYIYHDSFFHLRWETSRMNKKQEMIDQNFVSLFYPK